MLSNSLLPTNATAAAVDKLEADALRSPLTVRSWVQLIRAVDDFNIDPLNNDDSSDVNLADMFARFNRLNEIFERSLLHNPYSYKLWVTYLNHRIGQWGALSKLSLTTNSTPPHLRLWNGIVRVFERALERLPNMPLLWTNFLEFVACENVPEAARNVIPTMFTKFRVSLIDALQALPITQHALVWNVFRKWTATLRLDAAPFASLHSLWQLHLKGNTSDRVMGEYVQFLVKCQRNDALLQYLCSLGQWSAVQAKWTLPKLCQDSVFWDLIGGVLLSPSHNAKAPQQQQQQQQKVSPHVSLPVDSEKLIRFVLLGTSHSLQPDRLVLSLAVYLMRRGSFLEARSVLSNVLQTTTNTSTFQDAFVALVRMEEQLIDCVTLDDSAVTRFSSETELLNFLNARVFSVKSKETVGGEFNPLHGLTTLVRDYPLLLNAVQLRQKPHDARLWLKRVECLYERAAANGVASTDPSVVADVEHVLTQGVTLCKRNQAQFAADGLTTNDEQQSRGEQHDVSALYLAWSDLLVSLERLDEALELLKKATFAVAYSSTAMNAVLFGRLVEVLCLTSQNTSNPAGFAHSEESVKATVLTSMMAIIRGELDQWSEWKRDRTVNGGAAGSQQQRRVTASSMFLGQRGGAALKVLSAPELWTTAWDVVFWAEGAAGPHGEELSRWMSALGLYTPSIALGRASRLREKKLYLDSFLVLEDALNRCHQSSTEGAVAALELADAAAATVIEHMQHNLHNSFVSPLNEEDILEGQSSLRQLQILAGSTQQQPTTEMNKALFTEKLRGVLRQGLAAARVCASSSAAGEHHVHQAMVFFFTAAACEEYLGLYGHCIATLLDATRTFHTRMCKRSKAAALQKQQRSSAAVDESGAPVSVANEQQQVGEDTEANAKAQLLFDEDVFLKCVEAYSCKLLQLRGNTMFFSEVASLLKWTLSPRSQSEIALRLTAELTKARLIDKCRAVFTTLAPTQNPAERSGELFWGAWATFERDFGVEATFTSCQRTKRNVLAAFSKSEVKFENQ